LGSYIDLHLHLLPGLDDGPTELSESVAMVRGLAGLGYRKLVATPHRAAGQFEATDAEAEAALARVRAELDEDGAPELGLAREYYFDRLLLEDLMERRVRTLAPGGRTFLFEFPMDHVPPNARDVIFRARSGGYRPVLAHPERCSGLAGKVDLLRTLSDEGVALLVNLGSLVKLYGRRERKAGRQIIDLGLAAGLATDSHTAAGGVAVAADGLVEVERRWGEEALHELLVTGPTRLLEDPER